MPKDTKRTAKGYPLDTKIEALNEIDCQDGNFAGVSKKFKIALTTLKKWRAQEAELRQQYKQRRARERDRLLVDMQMKMLERGKEALEQIDKKMLESAPLNQLASAISSLISHALKLSDVIEEIHDEKELVIRHEYFTDGELRDAPPWAASREEFLEKIHGGGLREALGQDDPGQNGHSGTRAAGESARLVAGADLHNDGPGLAGLESGDAHDRRDEDQRERASH